jgi:four helix bundle protein
MATVKRFEDLKCWQEARALAHLVFDYFIKGQRIRDFEFVNQINDSSGSVMDNIGEGFERNGRKEFIHFLTIAKASVGETRSQLYRAFYRNYIKEEEFKILNDKSILVTDLIGGFIYYLKNTEYRGTKFVVNGPLVPYGLEGDN